MISSKQYGPWAVIAGGSEGVGASFARKLAQAGINLVLIARKEGPLSELAREVRTTCDVQVRPLQLDLTRPDLLERVREITDDAEVGLLIYNAGSSNSMGSFLQASLDDVMRAVRVKPIGQVSLAHHFGRKMAARGHGGIVLVGSMAGNAGAATMVTYSAANAFTQIFAEGLWSELKPRGIDVLCIVLGATDTPARARAQLKDSPDLIISDPDDVAQQCLDNIADGPVLVPPHMAEGFRQFCSMPRRQAAEAMNNLMSSFKE